MRSKLAKLVAVALAVVVQACGASSNSEKSGKYLVGRQPQFYSASYLWQGGDANQVVAVDREGRTVQQFTLEPFAHVRTVPLPLPYKDQGVVASADGRYFLTTGDSEYAIVGPDGSVQKNPVELLGKIASVAFDPAANLLVIADEFQTMVLLELDGDGNIVASWKAGALFPDGRYLVAGTMIPGGRLALSLGTTTLSIIDVRATIAAQSWQLTSFEIPDATDMNWIAGTPDIPSMLLIADGQRLLTVDATTGAVVDQRDLKDQTVRGLFRDYHPHAIVQTAGQANEGINEVVYMGADGKLVAKPLRTTSKVLLQTWLDPRAGAETLTLAFDPGLDYSYDYTRYTDDAQNPYRRQEIYRFRLSDNLAIDKTEVGDPVNAAITPGHVFLLYKSALGRAERRNYGKTPATERLEGYNLKSYVDRYRK